MSYQLPPVVKLAERLLVDIELAVRAFPRYEKYSVGAVLRARAMDLAEAAHNAWRDREHRGDRLEQLAAAVDRLKLTAQLASRLRAFRSLAQYEALSRIAYELGRQVGGWRRQQHPKGQDAQPRSAWQRAQTLLTTPMERAQACRAAPDSAAGIGVPSTEAHQRPSDDAGAFFLPAMGQPAQWRAVCGGRKARRPSDRYANRAPSVTSIGVELPDLTSEGGDVEIVDRKVAREDRLIARALRVVHARWVAPTTTLTCCSTSRQFFALRLSGLDREVFEAAFLDSRHRLLVAERLFLGTLSSSEVHPREVAKRALHHNAAAVIVAHNHPTGDPTPSRADATLTQRLRAALDLVGVRLLDHIVVGHGATVSFSESGLL